MVINGSSTKLSEGVVLTVPRLENVRLHLHFLRRGTSGIINPTPTNIVNEYQEEGNATVKYDLKTKSTTMGEGNEREAKKTPKR